MILKAIHDNIINIKNKTPLLLKYVQQADFKMKPHRKRLHWAQKGFELLLTDMQEDSVKPTERNPDESDCYPKFTYPENNIILSSLRREKMGSHLLVETSRNPECPKVRYRRWPDSFPLMFCSSAEQSALHLNVFSGVLVRKVLLVQHTSAGQDKGNTVHSHKGVDGELYRI